MFSLFELGHLSKFDFEGGDSVHVIAKILRSDQFLVRKTEVRVNNEFMMKKTGVRLVCDKSMNFEGHSYFRYYSYPYDRALVEIPT